MAVRIRGENAVAAPRCVGAATAVAQSERYDSAGVSQRLSFTPSPLATAFS